MCSRSLSLGRRRCAARLGFACRRDQQPQRDALSVTPLFHLLPGQLEMASKQKHAPSPGPEIVIKDGSGWLSPGRTGFRRLKLNAEDILPKFRPMPSYIFESGGELGKKFYARTSDSRTGRTQPNHKM